MSIINTYVAYRFLRLLVTPFEKTKAFELGVIDQDGNVLKKKRDRKTKAEKESYDTFHRLVFNLKKVVAKIPFMKGRLGSMATALYLIKEHLQNENYPVKGTELEGIFCQYLTENRILDKEIYMDFVEEYATMYLTEEGAANAVGSAPGNVAGLHGDPPVNHKKRKKYNGVDIFEVEDDIIKGIKLRTKSNLLDGIQDKKLRTEIKKYQESNPDHPIIFANKSGVMFFVTR